MQKGESNKLYLPYNGTIDDRGAFRRFSRIQTKEQLVK